MERHRWTLRVDKSRREVFSRAKIKRGNLQNLDWEAGDVSATQLRLGISHWVTLRHKRLGQLMDAMVSQSFLPLLNAVKTNGFRGHEVNLDGFFRTDSSWDRETIDSTPNPKEILTFKEGESWVITSSKLLDHHSVNRPRLRKPTHPDIDDLFR